MSCRHIWVTADFEQDRQHDLSDLLRLHIDDLVRMTVIAFRHHPHINNVMTHICGARWERIEDALRLIFNPLARHEDLSSLAENIVELLCAERGVTGRILKPYFQKVIAKRLSPEVATCLSLHIADLYLARQPHIANPVDADARRI